MENSQESLELQECEKNGVSGWRFGASGECFVGRFAKQQAFRAQKRAKVSMWREKPKKMRDKEESKAELKAKKARIKEQQEVHDAKKRDNIKRKR